MFPHEEQLKLALRDCKITKLVQDLGTIYVQMNLASNESLSLALKVDNILKKAAEEIANLGPKSITTEIMG
jgi:hypothetical protein